MAKKDKEVRRRELSRVIGAVMVICIVLYNVHYFSSISLSQEISNDFPLQACGYAC
jgi:hypothetical protein